MWTTADRVELILSLEVALQFSDLLKVSIEAIVLRKFV